jgi:hypothetical protein
MDFIDVKGASGGSYRFRAWPADGQTIPVAGNYVTFDPHSQSITLVGMTNNLAELRPANLPVQGDHLFIRLNIARTVRAAEHDDILQGHPDARQGEADAP